MSPNDRDKNAPAEEDSIGKQNVERLVERAYQPETPDPGCVRRVEEHVVKETSRSPRGIHANNPDSLTVAFQQLTGTDPITDTSPEWQPGQPTTGTSNSESNRTSPLAFANIPIGPDRLPE